MCPSVYRPKRHLVGDTNTDVAGCRGCKNANSMAHDMLGEDGALRKIVLLRN